MADVLGPDGAGREVGRDGRNLIQARGADPGNAEVARQNGGDDGQSEDEDEREKLLRVDHSGSNAPFRAANRWKGSCAMPIIEAVAGTGVAGRDRGGGGRFSRDEGFRFLRWGPLAAVDWRSISRRAGRA